MPSTLEPKLSFALGSGPSAKKSPRFHQLRQQIIVWKSMHKLPDEFLIPEFEQGFGDFGVQNFPLGVQKRAV